MWSSRFLSDFNGISCPTLQVEGVRLALEHESAGARPLAQVAMAFWALELSTSSRGILLESSLGNVEVEDGAVPPRHSFRKVVSTKGDAGASLIRVSVRTLPEAPLDSERCPRGLPVVMVDAKMSSVRLIFLNRFLSETLSYLRGFLEMQPPAVPPRYAAPVAHTEATPAVRTSVSNDLPQTAPVVVLLDLAMDAPVVMMPRGTDLVDYIELDLGKLQLSNRVGWLEGTLSTPFSAGTPALLADPSSVLVDSMSIQLSSIRGTVAVDGRRSPSLIEEGSLARIEVRRALRDLGAVHPAVTLRLEVPSFSGRLSDSEYLLITQISDANLNEDLRLPKGAYYTRPGALQTSMPPQLEQDASRMVQTEEQQGQGQAPCQPELSVRLSLEVGDVRLHLDRIVGAGAGSASRAHEDTTERPRLEGKQHRDAVPGEITTVIPAYLARLYGYCPQLPLTPIEGLVTVHEGPAQSQSAGLGGLSHLEAQMDLISDSMAPDVQVLAFHWA